MNAHHLDTALRSLTGMCSRHSVLIALDGIAMAGLVPHADVAARKHHRNRKKKPSPLSPPPPPPSVACPATCPVCQICNASTGSCEVRTDGNGLPGQNCQAPHVCCSGTCCADFPACNSAGMCGTCADACTNPNCTHCFTLADGSTRCGRFNFCFNEPNCTSSAQCQIGQECVTRMTIRSTNVTLQPCEQVGIGSCYIIDPCP